MEATHIAASSDVTSGASKSEQESTRARDRGVLRRWLTTSGGGPQGKNGLNKSQQRSPRSAPVHTAQSNELKCISSEISPRGHPDEDDLARAFALAFPFGEALGAGVAFCPLGPSLEGSWAYWHEAPCSHEPLFAQEKHGRFPPDGEGEDERDCPRGP